MGLAAKACQLVSARGAAFNRGVVFKEHVAARMYDVPLDLGGRTTGPNEWRLWFCDGTMVECSPFSDPVKTFLSRSPRSDERFRLGLISYQKASDGPLVTVLGAYK